MCLSSKVYLSQRESHSKAADAVVMSREQFSGLMETVHLLNGPANAAHLSKSIRQYRAGKTKQHELTSD